MVTTQSTPPLERSLDPNPPSFMCFQGQVRVSFSLVLEMVMKKKVLLARLIDPTINCQLQATHICLALLLDPLMLLVIKLGDCLYSFAVICFQLA